MLGRGYGITNFLINIAGTGGGVAPLVNTKSLAFDGVDDYMITEHAESGDITLSAWINCNGTYPNFQPRYPLSITPSHTSAPNGTIGRIYKRTTNQFYVMIQGYDETGANFDNYFPTFNFEGAGWKHCVWTFNNTTKAIYFYLDGIVQDWTKNTGFTTHPAWI